MKNNIEFTAIRNVVVMRVVANDVSFGGAIRPCADAEELAATLRNAFHSLQQHIILTAKVK